MSSKKKAIKHAIQDALINALTPLVIFFAGSCSSKMATRLARWSARAMAAFQSEAFKKSVANLAVAFPDKTPQERCRLAVASLQNSVEVGIDFMRLIRRPELIHTLCRRPDERFMQLTEHSACIVCLPHLGNWEILGQGLPQFGVKSAAVGEMFRNKKLNILVERARSRNGLTIIPREGAAKKMLSCLRQGYSTGILADQNVSPRESGQFLRFFGLPVPSSLLPAVLARRLHLPLIVGASIRLPDHTFQMMARVLPKAPNDYPDDLTLAQDILKLNEELIREYPDQYTWSYHRWRYIPQNAPDELAKRFPFYARRRPYDCPDSLLT